MLTEQVEQKTVEQKAQEILRPSVNQRQVVLEVWEIEALIREIATQIVRDTDPRASELKKKINRLYGLSQYI